MFVPYRLFFTCTAKFETSDEKPFGHEGKSGGKTFAGHCMDSTYIFYLFIINNSGLLSAVSLLGSSKKYLKLILQNRKVMSCVWVNKINERGRNFYNSSTSKHLLCCQVPTFSHHFTFQFLKPLATKPSSAVATFIWDGAYIYILVYKICCIVNNTTYIWVIFCTSGYW